MDRKPILLDVPRVVVQRRNDFNSASLVMSAHQVAIRLGPVSGITNPPASTTQDKELQSGQKPLQSIFEVKPEGTVVFAYHLIGHVTRLQSVPVPSAYADVLSTTYRAFPIWIRLRNFESLTLYFGNEQVFQDVFRSLRTCTVRKSVEQLAAFHPDDLQSALPNPTAVALTSRAKDEPVPSGWHVYDPKREFERQGVWSRTRAWRTTTLNATQSFCPTYPSLLVVPSRISDATLQHGAKFRSKCRLPALTYLHWAHLGTITRSSQPLVGLRYSRSVQDEKLVDAIFSSHLFAGSVQGAPVATSPAGNEDQAADSTLGAFDAIDSSEAPTSLGNHPVYGAKTTNVIIDARPTTNAYANHAKGAGSETMDYYPGCRKVFLGIDNIHVMRDSLKFITDALTDADVAPGFGAEGQITLPSLDPGQVKRSGWLRHITSLLEGAEKIVRTVHVECAHVLIHCSDGWDRTSQLSAVAQACLDPYFRTFQGFAVLIEKDFAAFGHRFMDRTGHLSHTSFFEDKFQASPDSDSDLDSRNGGFEPANAASALWGFTKSVAANLRGPQDQESVTHLKEISPVFHQFLDCIYQLHRQNPERFEFDTGWLVELHRALHECTTGTFLFNSEAERIHLRRKFSGLKSVWDTLLSPATKATYKNSQYDPNLDDVKRPRTDMGVLMPHGKDVRFWPSLFRRSDGALNAYIDAERAAQEEAAAQRHARRKRLEQRLEAAASGKALPPQVSGDEVVPSPDATTQDEYVGLAYRPYHPRAKSSAKPNKPSHHLADPAGHELAFQDGSVADISLNGFEGTASDDQGWDPAAAGKRQVRALWSAGRGWLFGGEQAATSEGDNPWSIASPVSPIASTAAGSAAPATVHNRNGSTSSWDANVWSEPTPDPLSTGMKNLQVTNSHISSSSNALHQAATTKHVGTRSDLLDMSSSPLALAATDTGSSRSPSVHPLDGPLLGDPLGASWSAPAKADLGASRATSPISRSGSTTTPLPPTVSASHASTPAPPDQPQPASSPVAAPCTGTPSRSSSPSNTKPTHSHRAHVSSDPLGVL